MTDCHGNPIKVLPVKKQTKTDAYGNPVDRETEKPRGPGRPKK